MADDRKRTTFQQTGRHSGMLGNGGQQQQQQQQQQQDFIEELAARVQALQRQNSTLLGQMANAAKLLNAAVIENQILKSELQALDIEQVRKGNKRAAGGGLLSALREQQEEGCVRRAADEKCRAPLPAPAWLFGPGKRPPDLKTCLGHCAAVLKARADRSQGVQNGCSPSPSQGSAAQGLLLLLAASGNRAGVA